MKILDLITRFYHSAWFTVFTVIFSLTVIYVILFLIYRRISRTIINKIIYKRDFSEDGVYEGEKVILTETIYNNSFIPLFYVDIEGYIYNNLRMEEYDFNPRHAMQYFLSRFKLIMPYMQIKRRHEITCTTRGYYKLESVQLFFTTSNRYIDSSAEIYVYPKILKAPTVPLPTSSQQGDSFSRRWLMRDPFSISGVRDYTFGDPFNSINFKATAKFGGYSYNRIKVKNRDFCSNRTIMVYMNFQIDPKNTIPTPIYNNIIERGLSYAADYLRDAAYNGYRAGFAANCCMIDGKILIKFPIESGELHYRDILRNMSCIRPAAGQSFISMLDDDIARGLSDTEVYILTTYVDPEIDSRLRTLRRYNNSINVLILKEDSEKNNEEESA